MRLAEVDARVPEDVIAAFAALGDAQRGVPEIAMVRAQHVMGGGVMSFAIEHTGDLIHRMSHAAVHDYWGQHEVYDKSRKVLRLLEHAYGFAREFEQNMRANAEYQGVSFEDHMKRVDAALKAYWEAHWQLPAYNHPQLQAKMAAVCLGQKNFPSAKTFLNGLFLTAGMDPERYQAAVMAFQRGPGGQLEQYRRG